MLAIIVLIVVLVALTLLVHYETLRVATDALPRSNLAPRGRILALVGLVFCAHVVEIGLYAITYFAIAVASDLGALVVDGRTTSDYADYVYFSFGSYTSLGLGDIVPIGPVRLLAGVETLNGLLLIGWSTSMTYLAMEKFWPLHVRRDRHPHG